MKAIALMNHHDLVGLGATQYAAHNFLRANSQARDGRSGLNAARHFLGHKESMLHKTTVEGNGEEMGPMNNKVHVRSAPSDFL